MKGIISKMKLKKIISLILTVITLLSLIPSFSAHAENAPEIKATELSDDQLQKIAEQSTSKLPDDLLQKLSLKDSDIPESMKNTNVRETDAVVRLKAQEGDMSSILYANRDGTYSEFFFTENVKYKKGDEIFDKSNVLTSSLKHGGYTNEQNDINVKLPFMLTKSSGIELSYGNYIVEFIPQNTGKLITTPEKTKEDTVVYNNVFGNGISLEYTVQFSGIKENIIISSDTSIYDFVFTVKTHGLFIKLLDDAAVICDDKDNIVADIGSVVILDSEGKAGEGSFKLHENDPGEEYTYTLSVSESFIKSENTVFPVFVDPTIMYNSGSHLYDSKITKYNDNYTLSYSDTTIELGKNATNLYTRELVNAKSVVTKVNNFSSISNLKSAYFYLFNDPEVTETINLRCYRMTESWGIENTIVVGSVWTGFDSSTVKSSYFNATTSIAYFNILSYFQYWYSNTNNGFMIKLYDESKNCTVVTKENSNSSLKPYVQICFYDLPSSQSTTIKNNSLYKMSTIVGQTAKYLICNRTNNSTYSLAMSTIPTATSTLASSPYFAFRYVSNGYYTISPTNANFRGSSALYTAGTNAEYFLYLNGTGVILSTSSNNNSYWYLINTTGTNYYLINKSNLNYCLGVNSSGSVTYSSGDNKWSLVFVGLDVPLIQQLPDYCGPCSVLQTLVYFNEQNLISDYSNYSGNSIYEKYQKALGNKMGTTSNGTSYIRIVNFYKPQSSTNPNGNTYGINHNYSAYGSNDLTTTTLIKSYVKNSLNNGYPVIIHAKTSHFSYYNGHSYGHFICLVGCDNDKYIVRDCINSNYYFGEFIITGTELLNMLPDTFNGVARHLICYTY